MQLFIKHLTIGAFKTYDAPNSTQIKLGTIIRIRNPLVHMGTVRLAGIAVLVTVGPVLGAHTSYVVEVITSSALVLNRVSVVEAHIVTAAVCRVGGDYAPLGTVGLARVTRGSHEDIRHVLYRVTLGQGVSIVEELARRTWHGLGGRKQVSCNRMQGLSCCLHPRSFSLSIDTAFQKVNATH